MINLNEDVLDVLKFYLPLLAILFVSVYGFIVLCIIPQDQIRSEIMNCMGDQLWTQALYDECAADIRGARSSP